MKKILLINPFGIGDVLFTTPVVRAIKETYPDCFLGYWCNERVEPILKNNPFIDKIFTFTRGDLKKIFKKSKFEGIKKTVVLFFGIKKQRFDIAVDFSLDHRYSLTCKFAGIKRRIGFNYKSRGRFLTDKINIEGYEDKHVVEYYLDILKFLNIDRPKELKLDLFLNKDIKEWSESFIRDLKINRPLIGIAPLGGESWGAQAYLKHWPISNYIELIKKLINEYNTKIILFGDENEKVIVDNLEKLLCDKVINLAGRLFLPEYAGILSKLDILITNDSGNIHIAGALGIKTVSIFGPVDERVYGPYPLDERHIVIKKKLACQPCYKKFKIYDCKYELSCLKRINPQEVFEAVKRLLI
ncbi:MAG: lipopolysaccharide heptosyltransferase II [Candidatus Omnitrophica bacterium]|nr:lipopolysaccharide heptosyltransferase II [Candidatus Omnitrophota bacterium]